MPFLSGEGGGNRGTCLGLNLEVGDGGRWKEEESRIRKLEMEEEKEEEEARERRAGGGEAINLGNADPESDSW